MLYAHIVTLFPEIFDSYLRHSILKRAFENGVFSFSCHNPIDRVPALKRVDSRPYGGGAGMVLQAEPILACYDDIKKHEGSHKFIFLTPGGETFTRKKVKEYAGYDNITFFCGHYEGIDERVAQVTGADKVSLGDFTLTGGEIPALAILDAVVRELPGTLGNACSLEDRRISSSQVYTRPETIEYGGKSYSVPAVLLSGHHKEIDEYREKN